MNEKKKILIIDDDNFLLGMYSMKFEKNGFETRIASQAADALKILREGYAPDVIIIDVIMPVMDGFCALEAIKKENLAPKALAVMLTNQGAAADITKARELGIDGYIIKATSIPAEVVNEVKMMLDKKTPVDLETNTIEYGI